MPIKPINTAYILQYGWNAGAVDKSIHLVILAEIETERAKSHSG